MYKFSVKTLNCIHMNEKLRRIVRDVAIGALLGIFPGSRVDAAFVSKSVDDKLSLANDDNNITTNRPGLTLRYAYNFATDEGTFHRSHRSHSSHSSHRSHYSSTSGTNNANTNQKTNTNTNTTPNNAVRTNVTPIQNQNINREVVYTLGSRNLQKGMSGDDVLELKKYLVKAKCYKMGEFEVLDNTFDQKTQDAVNVYKESKKLTKDGIVDAVVIYNLKND